MNETATEEVSPPVEEAKPPVIPKITARKPLELEFKVDREHMRRMDFGGKGGQVVLYLYPTLADWKGRHVPDQVNPRSHDQECLRSSVARAIEQTFADRPEDFHWANRGITILAKEYAYTPRTGMFKLIIGDADNQGLADGATTDAVIAKIQSEIKDRDLLEKARVHLEVIIGLTERDQIGCLVAGRNTSRQVKTWSLADFQGNFAWIQDILEKDDSKFKGVVGYEENAGKETSILDVLSILTLFHPEFNQKVEGRLKAPTVAYSNRGRMDTRLRDPELLPGYLSLAPILEDILRLHDHVYAGFEKAYNAAFGDGAKLGRRQRVKSRLGGTAYNLPLTGTPSNYLMPSGLVYPLLASLRALVKFSERKNGTTRWIANPFKFFDKNGPALISTLIEQVENLGGNPNVAGKRASVYNAVLMQSKNELSEQQAVKTDED